MRIPTGSHQLFIYPSKGLVAGSKGGEPCIDGDLDGILSDCAPMAVLFTPEGPLKGPSAMRPLFQAMFAELKKPGASFAMKQLSVEGDYAYIFWTAETADNVYEVGSDTFVVRDGKIVAQSLAAKLTPKR